MSFVRDLFTGLGNSRWELARVLAAWAVVTYAAAILGAYVKGQVLDFSAIGLGYAAVLAGAGGLIWAKDTARTAAASQASQDQATTTVAAAVADHVTEGAR